MNEVIGFKNIYSLDDINSLKQEFFLFDKIFLVGYQEFLEVIDDRGFKNTSELLSAKGLIPISDFVIYQGYLSIKEQMDKSGDIKTYSNSKYEHKKQTLQFLEEEGKIIYDYNYLNFQGYNTNDITVLSSIITKKIKSAEKENNPDFFSIFNLCHDVKTRLVSASCRKNTLTPIPCNTSFYEIKDLTNIKADTYNLILEDFPIIDTNTLSWTDIFAFKNDKEVFDSIWGLRNWISNISKTDKTITEIEEEYRYLKYKYEQIIKLHKLRTSSSTFQTVLYTSAELAENVVKLKFSKIADVFFKFQENKISLLEAELNAEGSQLSYLFKINNRFKTTS